jgi:integrase
VEKEPATVRSYSNLLNGHVLPALGRIKLRDLHRSHVKAFLADKRRQGLAKNTVRLMKAALSAMLSDVADDGIIDSNPALQLGRRKASRADKLSAAERIQKVRPLSWEQRGAFLEAAAAERPYGTLFALLAKGGLRPGEAFALKPGDLISAATRCGWSGRGASAGSSRRRPRRRARWTSRPSWRARSRTISSG